MAKRPAAHARRPGRRLHDRLTIGGSTPTRRDREVLGPAFTIVLTRVRSEAHLHGLCVAEEPGVNALPIAPCLSSAGLVHRSNDRSSLLSRRVNAAHPIVPPPSRPCRRRYVARRSRRRGRFTHLRRCRGGGARYVFNLAGSRAPSRATIRTDLDVNCRGNLVLLGARRESRGRWSSGARPHAS